MKTTTRFLALCTLTASFTMPAKATPELSLANIEPYSAEFDYYIHSDTSTSLKGGSWTDLVTIDNGLLSRTVTRFTNDHVVDLKRTVIVDQVSIAPIRVQQRFGPDLSAVFQIDFTGQSMTQVLIGAPTNPARVTTAELSNAVFETGLHAVFALSLPLSEATEITVDTYLPGAQPQVVPKIFHIIGQERVEAMGQSLNTWRIEDRAQQWTYWVRPDKPYIVKVTHPTADGAMATSLVKRFD